MPHRLPLLLALLALPTAALAQEDEPRAPTSLDGVGRITVGAGVRLTTNDTLYDSWYSSRGPGGTLERGSDPRGGGPLMAATFAYAVSDLMELGIDLFATGGTLHLLEPETSPGAGPVRRKFTTLSYGALVGLRFQGVLDVGSQGLVPFAGILTGPAVASSTREGGRVKEVVTQAWMGSLGATLRLTEHWGVTAEYRLTFLRGPVEAPTPPNESTKWGPFSFNGGGNWFTVGVTYAFAPDPSRPVPRF